MGSIHTSHGNHNLRQRKKLRLGEFQELGFDIMADLTTPLSKSEANALLDELLLHGIVANRLLFIGTITPKLAGVVITESSVGSATEEQRQAVTTWLSARKEFKNPVVGPLRDVHYSSSDTWLGLN